MINTSKEAKNVYEIVKKSQKFGLDAVKQRVICKSVDDACRKIINDSLDHISSSVEIPIFELNNVKFQVFIVETITEFDSSTMYANAFYNVTIDEQTYSAAKFHFDSFLTSPGDESTVIWTIARVV